MSGCLSGQAMRLHGHLGSIVVEILVDSNSTHNFLDLDVVKQARV